MAEYFYAKTRDKSHLFVLKGRMFTSPLLELGKKFVDSGFQSPPQPNFKPRTLEELRSIATPYLPTDRQFIKLYLLDDPAPQGEIFISDGPIDLYSSEWLKTRFSAGEWHGKGPLGYFNVQYYQDSIWIDIGQLYPTSSTSPNY